MRVISNTRHRLPIVWALSLAAPLVVTSVTAWGEPLVRTTKVAPAPAKIPVSIASARQSVISKLTAIPAEKRSEPTTLMSVVQTAVGTSDMRSLVLAALEYQKIAEKEVREDAKLAKGAAALALLAKASKLALDNKSIEEGMKEADEKAQNLMEAAVISLWTGVIGGLIQMGGGAAGAAQGAGATSDYAAGAIVDTAIAGALPAAATTRMAERRGDFLAIIATGSPQAVIPSLRDAFQKDPVLAAADQKLLLPLAMVQAYREATGQLREALERSDTPPKSIDTALVRTTKAVRWLRWLRRQLAI
jgi:hypothetical protein